MNVKHLTSVIILALLLSTAGGAYQSPGSGESFTGVASNISEIGRTGITAIDINITRLTDEGENERLMAAFDERGQAGLISALQKSPAVARVRVPGSLGYDFRYARQISEKDGVRRILLVADRPIGFGELSYRGRSLDYPFTLIDLRIDASGRGSGTMFLASKIIRSGDLFVLENFVTRPVVISDVKRRA
jgi:hypothetical protein